MLIRRRWGGSVGPARWRADADDSVTENGFDQEALFPRGSHGSAFGARQQLCRKRRDVLSACEAGASELEQDAHRALAEEGREAVRLGADADGETSVA